MRLCFSKKIQKLDDPKWIASLIYKFCKEYKVRPDILSALIFQESRGDIWAQRYELGFYKKFIEWRGRNDLSGYVPPQLPTLITEKMNRATSFGLCQLLGETLRVQGFKGDYMIEACNPEINIKYGCLYLKKCLDLNIKQGSEILQYKAALSLYNGIRNHENSRYDELVLSHLETGAYKNVLVY